MHINILKCSPVKLNKLTLSFSDKCCEDEQNLYSKVFGNFNIIFHVLKNHKKSPPLPLNLIPSKYPKPINSKCIQYYCTSYLFHPPPLRNEKKIINAYLHHQSSSSSTATPFFDNTGTTGNYCWSTIITNKFMLKTPLQIFTTCSILFKHHFIPTIIKT